MHLYSKFTLKNGLRVIHLEDKTRTTVVLNTLYNVGARDENENKTGFAHLFEHLMFAGSENVPVFDKEVEEAGGQNNAFTNNEFTNYYLVMPSENVETAFWLESDRMRALTIDENLFQFSKVWWWRNLNNVASTLRLDCCGIMCVHWFMKTVLIVGQPSV